MAGKLGTIFALLALVTDSFAASRGYSLERKLRRTTIPSHELLQARQLVPDPPIAYTAYNIAVPVDHFHNDSLYEPHSNGTFNLRYWFDAQYYKPGGPVIVLQSGETAGEDRLPYLQKGLLHQLAMATNGIGVVLEHRYYGESMPTPDFSTVNLRFLTTDQALADEAYFAKNVVFTGLEHLNLTAPNVAYIGYGGSYAGAFNAFLRKLYPDVFWGTISSSGVVEAIWDYWAYFEPIRWYADKDCMSSLQKITHVVDNILIGLNDNTTTAQLKSVFGLSNVTYNNDFAAVIALPLEYWQNKNWDPAVNDPTFDNYCEAVSNSSVVYSGTESLKSDAQDLLKKGGYASEVNTLITPMLNMIGWLQQNIIATCQGGDQDSCFGTHNPASYTSYDINQSWRAWPYQYCTQWGYLATGSGVPKDQLPLVSRTNDLAYESLICNYAFNITTPPDVDAINKYGGFGISYPRLAFIDGEHDPWRPATVHASPFNSTAENRTSTTDEPFHLIPRAVHHWDENGLFPNQTVDSSVAADRLPPDAIRDVQSQELRFVKAWMKEWKEAQASLGKKSWRYKAQRPL